MHTKYVSNLKFLAASGDLCAVVLVEKNTTPAPGHTRVTAANMMDSEETTSTKLKAGSGRSTGREDFIVTCNHKTLLLDSYVIQLRNSIGAVVDAKVLPFCPKHISMSPFHVTLTNDRTVYTWQFQSSAMRGGGAAAGAAGLDDTVSPNSNNSRMVHTSKMRMFDINNTSYSTAQSPETFTMIMETIADPITCTAISDKYLIVGRKSGVITR